MTEKPINNYCPRSGRPVQSNSLTEYRNFAVGFCNPKCRDDFKANQESCREDRHYFDILIKELDLDLTD